MGTGSYGTSGGSQGGGGGASGYSSVKKLFGFKSKGNYNFYDDFIKIFKSLNSKSKPYLRIQVTNEMLNNLYKELFLFSVEIFQNKTWDNIQNKWSISDQKGCLQQFASQATNKYGESEQNPKVRQNVKMTFENFLLKALGDDINLYHSGSSEQIIDALDRRIFNSTSSNFLGTLLSELVKLDREPSTEARYEFSKIAIEKSDEIIRSFELEFYHKNYDNKQITYDNLFDIIKSNYDWFIKHLTK
jgi:hypothetical protein